MARGALKAVEKAQAPALHIPSDECPWEKQRLEESKKVRGIFQDNELKGGTIRFPFKKFKGDPIVDYTLTDGQEYELPLAVVKHINSNCAYTQDGYVNGLVTADGKPMKNPNAKKFHRFSFKISEYC